MRNQWTILAQYDNFLQANQDAQILKSEGIPCQVECTKSNEKNSYRQTYLGEIHLKVTHEDKELAALTLDMSDFWLERPDSQDLSHTFMLIGMIITLMGLFLTISSFSVFTAIWRCIPLGITVMGVLLFWKGIHYAKLEHKSRSLN